MEVYVEDGQTRPFFAVVETPGSGNVVIIVNTSNMEYPRNAIIKPYKVDAASGMSDIGQRQGMFWSE